MKRKFNGVLNLVVLMRSHLKTNMILNVLYVRDITALSVGLIIIQVTLVKIMPKTKTKLRRIEKMEQVL